jgi:hypothetical protein
MVNGNSAFLGSLAWQFTKPEGHIYENLSAKVVEFYPAGYTQKFIRPYKNISGAAEEVNRQEFYQQLYEEAADINRESEVFPFENYEYKIDFVREPNNKYDPFALRVSISTPNNNYWNDYHAGYVPARINQLLLANIERISDIQILSVIDNLNDKFYCARIGLGYDGTVLNTLGKEAINRFKYI